MIHTPLTVYEIKGLSQENTSACAINYLLFQCRTNQPFRVAVGKSKWFWYNLDMNFQRSWNLREILSDEIVIEFDTDDRDVSLEACRLTTYKLNNLGISYEIWDHNGKSPHIHIRNLPTNNFGKNKLKEYKKFLVKKFVPEQYYDIVDFSLTGIHLIALEHVNHWKGKYQIKELIQEVKA